MGDLGRDAPGLRIDDRDPGDELLVVFNLVWYVLRRLGLRAFFAPAQPLLPEMAAACGGAPAAKTL